MSEINPERLRELAERVRQVLEEDHIKFERFDLSVHVRREYYEGVKHNFPDRHPADRLVYVMERDWSIQLSYSVHGDPPKLQDQKGDNPPQMNPDRLHELVGRISEVESKQGNLNEKLIDIPPWTHLESEHVLEFRQGRAVIGEETKKSGGKLYRPHIEDSSGNVIAQFEPGFEDFETANAFIRANLIELDRVGIDEAIFREKLAATLDMCVEMLITGQPPRVFHRLRLENIKRWLLHQNPIAEFANLHTTNWTNYIFNWQHQQNRYQCTTPHGKAIIIEIFPETKTSPGNVASYNVQLEDETRVVLGDFYYTFSDFPSAETGLRRMLTELERPFIYEVYLNYLSFTLQICQSLLPADSDPINIVRLRYIDAYLWEVLP